MPASASTAELRRGEIVNRVSEIAVIEDVEGVQARLKWKPLVELELSEQRQIDLRSAASGESVLRMAAASGRQKRAPRWVFQFTLPVQQRRE